MKNKQITVIEQILDTIPYFVFWKDLNSNYLGANEKFALSAGFNSAEEMVGKSDFDTCWTREEAEFFRKIDRQVMESNEPIINLEEPQKQLDGTTKIMMTSKVPLHDQNGKVIGILGIYTDITSRKILEDEKDRALQDLKAIQQAMIHSERMRCLGEMAGGIAHEINNPLAIINGNVSIIRELMKANDLQPEMLEEMLNDIEKTVIRMSDIVKSMRTMTRDQSEDEFKTKPESLNEIIQESVILCEQKFKNLDIDLEIENDFDDSFMLDCNRIALGQVLLNLLHNSRDAVLTTEGTNHVVKIQVAKDADGCRISVLDSGPGIHEKLRTKIFQPFFTTKEFGKGTGIGLSLSKGLIEKQGGTLVLDTESTWTKFSILFRQPRMWQVA